MEEETIRRNRMAALAQSFRAPLQPEQNIKPFGNFGDLNGWPAQVPSEAALKLAYMTRVESTQEQKTRRLMAVKGKVIAGDHTFSIAKVPVSSGEKLFQAFYSVMNEFNMIMGYWLTATKSLLEVEPNLKAVSAFIIQCFN